MSQRPERPFLRISVMLTVVVASMARGFAAEPIGIQGRRELLVDDYLIEKMDGARLVLHQPMKREVAVNFDAPWEGNNCGYCTVFQDGDLYRMYYMIAHHCVRRK